MKRPGRAGTSSSSTGRFRHEHHSYHYCSDSYFRRRRWVLRAWSLWDCWARRRFGARFDCHHSGLARRWDGRIWSAPVTPLRRRFARPTAWEVAFGLWVFFKSRITGLSDWGRRGKLFLLGRPDWRTSRSRGYALLFAVDARPPVSLRQRPPGVDLDVGDSCVKSGAMIVSTT